MSNDKENEKRMCLIKYYSRESLLDLVKMICILMIVTTHISWTDAERNIIVFPLIIDMAVPIFLIISAYLRTKKISSLGYKKFISIRYSFISFMNLMVAYIIVVAIEILIALIFKCIGKGDEFPYLNSLITFIKWFIAGATGPGSYYVPIMIQLIIYFPIVYLFFRKDKNRGLIISALINLIYELIVYFTNLNPAIYRFLIFRYTLLLGFGIYLAFSLKERKDDVIAIIFFFIGLVYILVNAYIVQFPLFQEWKSTSMLCSPFAYGVMYYLMKWFSHVKYHNCFVIGRASYHIFLTQMVFYGFGGNILWRNLLPMSSSPFCEIMGAAISIMICVPVGLLFYFVETSIRKAIHISH